jgi:hypothetical protein
MLSGSRTSMGADCPVICRINVVLSVTLQQYLFNTRTCQQVKILTWVHMPIYVPISTKRAPDLPFCPVPRNILTQARWEQAKSRKLIHAASYLVDMGIHYLSHRLSIRYLGTIPDKSNSISFKDIATKCLLTVPNWSVSRGKRDLRRQQIRLFEQFV